MSRIKTGGGVKRWLEDISVEMGLDGEITDEVMEEGEKRMLGEAFKKMRDVTKVKYEDWDSNVGHRDMTLTVDGESVVISIEPSGKVYWWDFTHKTYLGKVDRTREVVKNLQTAFKAFEQGLLTASDLSGELVKMAKELIARHPLDGARKHQLMPSNIKSKIPKLYSQEEVEDPIVWVKYFTPYGRGDWYITEFDGRDTMFGWADLGHGELGYISLDELESAERNGLPLVERDLSWRPMPLSKAKRR